MPVGRFPAARIVPCTACHCEVIAALHDICFARAWRADVIARMLRTAFAFGFLAAGARDGEAPWGFVLARAAAGECEILSLGVAPSRRRRGVGGALLQALKAEAGRRGAQSIHLEVAENNVTALALYGAVGFTEAGLRRGYYRDGGASSLDAVLLRFDFDRRNPAGRILSK